MWSCWAQYCGPPLLARRSGFAVIRPFDKCFLMKQFLLVLTRQTLTADRQPWISSRRTKNNYFSSLAPPPRLFRSKAWNSKFKNSIVAHQDVNMIHISYNLLSNLLLEVEWSDNQRDLNVKASKKEVCQNLKKIISFRSQIGIDHSKQLLCARRANLCALCAPIIRVIFISFAVIGII